MKITLKNIQYAAFASQETHCYSATVYADGKKLCHAQNDGHGGCDNFTPLRGEDYSRIKAVEKELAKITIKSTSIDDYEFPNSLEVECGDRMNEWHTLNEVKKVCRKVSYLKDRDSDDIYQMPAKYKPTRDMIAAVKSASWWNHDWILLNELAPAEIIKLPAFSAC